MKLTYPMPRKVLKESIKRLTVELPESEYKILETYCLEKQESKRQVIRFLIRSLNASNYLKLTL